MWLYQLFRAWLARLDPFRRARAAALNLLERILVALVDEAGRLRRLDESRLAKIAHCVAFAEHGVRVCAAIKAKSARPVWAPPPADAPLPSAFALLQRARAAMRALRRLDPSVDVAPGCLRRLRGASLKLRMRAWSDALARVRSCGAYAGEGARAPNPARAPTRAHDPPAHFPAKLKDCPASRSRASARSQAHGRA